MKIAVINTKGRFLSRTFLEEYSRAGIDFSFSNSLDSFLEEFGSFRGYDGVLMHPPLGMHGERFHETWLKKVQEISPDIRIAFATTNIGDTVQKIDPKIDIPLIDFENITEIKRYFRGKSFA